MANGNGKRRGRPMLRDLWAAAIWDQLWKARPNGLTPSELREATGLSRSQVRAGANYMRDLFDGEHDVPLVYVRSENRWHIAPTWAEHTRQAIRAEYLQQSSRRLESAENLLAKAERAFPAQARRIRKVQRNANYLRAETEDLIAELMS
jgi:hypothetical protein